MSDTLTLSPGLIDAYKTIMQDPAAHGFIFRPLNECFETSEAATPKHILFKEYVDYIDKPLPKVIFYIVMDALYSTAKAANGDLGYKVKFIPQ